MAGLPIMCSESLVSVVATGDNVEQEDVEQRDNPEVFFGCAELGAGSDQRELCLTSLEEEGRGYLLAANASRTSLELIHQADITGAC